MYLVLRNRKTNTRTNHNIKITNVDQAKSTYKNIRKKLTKINVAILFNSLATNKLVFINTKTITGPRIILTVVIRCFYFKVCSY